MKIHNLNNIPNEYEIDYLGKACTQYLGKLAGSEKIYINIDKVQPGAKSAKYHSHSMQEEFFLILDGCGTLRINDQEIEVQKGDFIAKPAGKNIAHQFINTGQEVLEILDVGTNEKDDICYYPDEGIFYLRNQGKAFHEKDVQVDWDSEPNK